MKNKCYKQLAKESYNDSFDEFACSLLTRRGVYPLTAHNRDIVESEINDKPSYRSNLNQIVSDWNDDAEYENEIYDVIADINRTNKTHIQIEEMQNIASRICSLCRSKHELIDKLNSDDGVKDIFIAIVDKERDDFPLRKSYLSFASKFIVCISKALGTIYLNQYTKYDSIVSDRLPDYLDIYFDGSKNFRSLEFKIDSNLSPKEKWEKYKQYCKCMVALKDKANNIEEGNPSFSLEEIDHMIWFFGKKSLSILCYLYLLSSFVFLHSSINSSLVAP